MKIVKSENGSIRLQTDQDIDERKAELQKQYDVLKPQLDAVEAEVKEIWAVEQVLSQLPTSWARRDPGKYNTAYWFSDKGTRKKAILPEFVQPDQEVPSYLLVRSLEQLEMTACPDCQTDQPLIYKYEQTEDSPDGDEWLLQTLVVCCGKVHVLSERSEDNRFF